MPYLQAKQRCWDKIKKYYPEYEDKQPIIESMIRRYLQNDIILLDIGCGRGNETVLNYKENVGKSIGIDVSEAIKLNDTIHHAIRADACSIPIADSTIDFVVSQELIEHLSEPNILFKEISRILKPNGFFILSTPNLLSWKSFISFITPYKFHVRMNKKLHGIDSEDIFPTYYRMNRIKKIIKEVKNNNMVVEALEMWEGTPKTLTFNILATYLDIFLTTLLRTETFKNYREMMVVCIRKK